MRYLLYAVIVAFLVFYTFFPLPNCNIQLNCDNVAHLIVSRIEMVYDEDGNRHVLYLINALLRQKKINLKREILQCDDEYATLWAGDTLIHRHNVRAPEKRENTLTPDSFSFGRDSLTLVRETEEEAFALARAICAEKTDPELRP